MKLGDPLPTSLYSEWRFVTSDLYRVGERVTEYDADCRLIYNPKTDELGLARWVSTSQFMQGGAWMLARRLRDTVTGEPLRGEPDPRVLVDQRASDIQRVSDRKAYYRAEKQAIEVEARRRQKERIRDNEEHGERFAYAWRRGAGRTNGPVHIPAGLPANPQRST